MSKAKQDDALYASLLSAMSNSRQQQSLERVKAACDALEGARMPITPTSVGKYCEAHFQGPKQQSIRNAKDTLFAYLLARKAKQVLAPSAKKPSSEPPIQDENVRAFVALIKAERDEALRTKNRIISGLRSIPGVPIDDLIANGFQPVSPPPNVARQSVSENARRAIAKLLASDALASVGLELYRQRLRHAVTKQVLLEKSDVEALSALLASETPAGAPQLQTKEAS